MAKRVATTLLTKDNCEDEDEPEEIGVFQQASEDELKTRVVKKGKRRVTETSAGAGSSPFLGFSGFGTKATIPNFSFINKTVKPSVTNGNTASSVEVDAEKSQKTEEISRGEYYKQLKFLNECFQQWIQKHLLKNPYCDFTPVCSDYDRHLKELNKKFPQPSHTIDANTETVTENFQSTVQKASSGKESTGFTIGVQPPSGMDKSASPIKSPLTTSEASKPFSFVAAAKSALTKPQGKEEELVVIDDDEGPPKNKFTPVEEQDSIYNKRCKLFFKKDNDYADKGVGVLYLKKLDSKTQLLIRADTNLGNILLNIILNKSLPIQRTGKNNVLIVCIPNPPIDNKHPNQEPIPMLIRVKTSEDADELHSKLVELAT